MQESPTLSLLEHIAAASLKFNYFITGITGAITAYVAKGYTPTKIGMNTSTLELIPISLLAISFFLGIKRLEHAIFQDRINLISLALADKRRELVTKFHGAPLRNTETGVIFTPEQVLDMLSDFGRDATDAEKALQKAQTHGGLIYRAQHAFLFLGILALIVCKLIGAYL